MKNNLNNLDDKIKKHIKYIAFLGPKGSFSNLAANKYSQNCIEKIIQISCLSFYESIKYVESNIADYAILPIENNNSGIINDVYNILKKTSLFIIDEVTIPINHCILIAKNTNLQKIETIYSHPEPFKQCSNFIKLFPHWKKKYTNSTAIAMKKIININSSTVAALGSKEGGRIYKLKVLKRDIANIPNNTTRFIILSKKL